MCFVHHCTIYGGLFAKKKKKFLQNFYSLKFMPSEDLQYNYPWCSTEEKNLMDLEQHECV